MTDTPPTPQNGVLYWMWSFEKLSPFLLENIEANRRAAMAAYTKRFGVGPAQIMFGQGYYLCGPVPEGMTK